MVFLGFLLVAAAILAGVGVALDNAEAANLVLFGQTVPGVTEQWQVFLAGAAVALVLCCGTALTFTGAARRIRTRRDLRDLREEHEESLTALVAEKRRLERELAQAQRGAGAGRPEPAAPRPAGETGPLPRWQPATAAPGVRVAPKNPGASPFFSRND
ncbi:hypothetical protein [Actinomadura sp. 6K520]|jgi:hypothetical protein|uniref:hypothetical protein n=1 Tax=Actinomadura sp. 6K520 TaxID=2530364 RepID=UPI001A9E4AE1|nr:hypothetical protein [Actinomadura sp. 6K520]